MSSETDKIKGTANVVAGKVKESVGKTIGDDKMEAEGAGQNVKGRVQQAVGDGKSAVKKVIDKA